jgi:beta-xylosidase
MTRLRLQPRRTGASLVAAVAAVLAAAACGSSSPSDSPASPSSPSPASPSGSSTGAHGYVNPVYSDDFPDPGVLHVGRTFHAYGTQGNNENIQTLTSTDLTHWTAGADALPSVGGWASPGNTWAPEVVRIGGQYAMYYVAHDNASGKQCIGRAVSSSPAGPFHDRSSRALVCQAPLGGSIDPDPVHAPDGSLYLYWKNDGNCCGAPVHLWGQRLSPDGAQLVGKRVPLLSNTRPWQGNLVEAPEMVVRDGHYTLFYSANNYASTEYGIGYATCRTPLGPCTDRSNASLIASNDVAAGPGHCFVLQLSDGRWWMLYHAWPPDTIGSSSPGRQLWLEPMTWQGDRPSVHASQHGPQAAPLPRSS